MTIPAKIAIALVKAQAAARAVDKASRNNFHGYQYASAEDVLAAGREAMNSAGLALICAGWTLVPSANAEEHDRIHVRYLLVHAEGDSYALEDTSTPVIPEKGRPEDKAEATALTYSIGYTMRGLLCLPRGASEDDDVNKRDDRGYDPRRRAEKAPFERQQSKPAGTAPTSLKDCTTLDQTLAWVRLRARPGWQPDRNALGKHLGKLMAGAPESEIEAAKKMIDDIVRPFDDAEADEHHDNEAGAESMSGAHD